MIFCERFEYEHTCWDPKDGELYMNRVVSANSPLENSIMNRSLLVGINQSLNIKTCSSQSIAQCQMNLMLIKSEVRALLPNPLLLEVDSVDSAKHGPCIACKILRSMDWWMNAPLTDG